MKDFGDLIGEGEASLNVMQMALRALIIFIATIIVVRVAGRRAFGMLTPLDNVITILLGSVLGRAIIDGSTPFWNMLAIGLLITLFQRGAAWLCLKVHWFASAVKGHKLALYKDGQYDRKNMARAQISEEDIEEGIRMNGHVESLDEVKTVNLERDGTISITKSDQ